MGDVIESKALKILETYEGGNNYILELKERFLSKKNFFPTRTQAEYVIKFSNKNPKIARKWVKLDSYFANKIANCLFTSW